MIPHKIAGFNYAFFKSGFIIEPFSIRMLRISTYIENIKHRFVKTKHHFCK